MAPGCPTWHWETGGAREETVVEMGNSIGMRWGLLKPKLRMKVVVGCCWFHVLSVSFSGFYGYESALNSLYDDSNEPTLFWGWLERDQKRPRGTSIPCPFCRCGRTGRSTWANGVAQLCCKSGGMDHLGSYPCRSTCRSLTKSL